MDNDYLPDPAEERSQRRFQLLNGRRNEAEVGTPIPIITNVSEEELEAIGKRQGWYDPNLVETSINFEQPTITGELITTGVITAEKIVPNQIDRPDSNPKSAFGIKKPSMHLIPGTALMMLAKVMALGASKYGAYNWRDQPVAATVYLSAALRHIYQWLDGEDIDPESGAPHLAHAMADMAILLDAFANNTLIDDRPNTRSAQTTRIINELTVKD